jgi:hypothetical protein
VDQGLRLTGVRLLDGFAKWKHNRAIALIDAQFGSTSWD